MNMFKKVIGLAIAMFLLGSLNASLAEAKCSGRDYRAGLCCDYNCGTYNRGWRQSRRNENNRYGHDVWGNKVYNNSHQGRNQAYTRDRNGNRVYIPGTNRQDRNAIARSKRRNGRYGHDVYGNKVYNNSRQGRNQAYTHDRNGNRVYIPGTNRRDREAIARRKRLYGW